MTYLYQVILSDDFEEYYKIKADKTAILWSGFKSAPDKEKLKIHFYKLINDVNVYLYFLKDDQTHEVIGYDQMVRLDEETVESAGHSIKSEYQGKGYGNLIFKLLVEKAKELHFKKFVGWISENNIGSIKNVENSGFVRTTMPCRMTRLEALGREDRFFMWERIL